MNSYKCETDRTVYVIGHKSPDTDSVCSAIAYADLKRHLGVNAIPARAGSINRETRFVLNYFDVTPPDYIATVKTQVSDLNMDIIKPVSPDISMKEAWNRLKENSQEVLPVENPNQTLAGIVSVSDIANAYMDMSNSNALFTSHTSVANVMGALNAKLICGSSKSFIGTSSGKVAVAATAPNEMKKYIGTGDVVFTGGIKANQIQAINMGAVCLIVTCGDKADNETVELAKNKNCTVLTTEYDTFTSARLIYQSIPVKFIMTSEKLVLFHIDDIIDNVKEKMLKTRYRSYPVVDSDSRFKGFISRYHLLNQRKKQVIMVDHSEEAQAVNGIEQAEILEIIDHHRIGGLQTGSPIYYRNEPVGSTATIISKLHAEQQVEISPQIAGILCSAIISDTVKFKSPTSTQEDYEAAEQLAEIAGIDIDKFSSEMFGAGFSLKGLSTEEIIKNDFKEYVIGKYKVGVGQVFTSDIGSQRALMKPLLECLNNLLLRGNYNILILLFTDVIAEKTQVLFVESQDGLVEKVFSPLNDKNSFFINGVVSRKKQIIPKLVSVLSR